MRRILQLVLALLLIAGTTAFSPAHSQIYTQPHAEPPPPAPQKNRHGKPILLNTEWLWSYSPSTNTPDGDENGLIQDPRFMPFLEDNLTAPQSFWGVKGTKYKPLPDTALDFLSVPGKVVADDNRYLSITGCVFHFCPSRGLLWVDLNPVSKAALKSDPDAPDHLVVFAAVDWIRDSKPTSDPTAEYTLWLFPNRAFGLAPNASDKPEAPNPIPQALVHSLSRFTQRPIPGSAIVENITHAIVVDTDGTPLQVPIATLGITPPKQPAGTDNQ